MLLALAALATVGARAWYRYKYPYGYSHACSKGLGLSLSLYARDHDGWLPHGGTTPEASLGLLAKDDMNSAFWVLGGKNIPRAVVRAALTNAGAFGPDTCGWHYIEGLRQDDDPQIAVAWDKVIGLWHNGDRRRGLMHEVVFLDGSIQFITKARWPQFVADEKERLAKVIASRQSNDPPIRWSDEATLGPNQISAPPR